MRAALGIDPGMKGGIVWLNRTGSEVNSWRMPVIGDGSKAALDRHGLLVILRDFQETGGVVAVEAVGARPTDSRVGAFTFGRAFEAPISMCAGLGVEVQLVRPQDWTRVYLRGKPRGKFIKKSAAEVAQLRFPTLPLGVKANWGMADAALIASYVQERNHMKIVKHG